MKDHEIDEMLCTELRKLMPNIIWRDEQGDYHVFGRYSIRSNRQGCEVWSPTDLVGRFMGTKTALSWCIADKFQRLNLAREIQTVDRSLQNLKNDIFVRTGVASRVKNSRLQEAIETKLETKIIRRKELELQLEKCINLAKYYQQRGFNNETARNIRTGSNKTNR